jgi:hypothetical protein
MIAALARDRVNEVGAILQNMSKCMGHTNSATPGADTGILHAVERHLINPLQAAYS